MLRYDDPGPADDAGVCGGCLISGLIELGLWIVLSIALARMCGV